MATTGAGRRGGAGRKGAVLASYNQSTAKKLEGVGFGLLHDEGSGVTSERKDIPAGEWG